MPLASAFHGSACVRYTAARSADGGVGLSSCICMIAYIRYLFRTVKCGLSQDCRTPSPHSPPGDALVWSGHDREQLRRKDARDRRGVLGPYPPADVLGDVRLGARCWIGPGARLRGDYGSIVLGDCCAVEDNCVVHATPGRDLHHRVLGHARPRLRRPQRRSIGDFAVIGMGAVVSDWAEIGEWAVVAEGAVVPQRAVVPAARIAAGVPARLVDRAVDEDFKATWRGFKQRYVDLCERYRSGSGPDPGCDPPGGDPPRAAPSEQRVEDARLEHLGGAEAVARASARGRRGRPAAAGRRPRSRGPRRRPHGADAPPSKASSVEVTR